MVFLRRLQEDRDRHLLQVELDPAQRHAAGRQLVVAIALPQIEEMHRHRHARRVGVPVEKVERHRVTPEQVIVDDEGPDQVVRAKHVERRRHGLAFEHAAARPHLGLHGGELLVVDEDRQIARVLEVGLRREIGDRRDALVLLRSHVRERRRHQRAADAIADRVDLLSPRLGLDRIERRIGAEAHVVLERARRQRGVRIGP